MSLVAIPEPNAFAADHHHLLSRLHLASLNIVLHFTCCSTLRLLHGVLHSKRNRVRLEAQGIDPSTLGAVSSENNRYATTLPNRGCEQNCILLLKLVLKQF